MDSDLSRIVNLIRFSHGELSAHEDALATEEPLEIRISFERGSTVVSRSISVTMRTPGHDAELAVGFLFSEGIVSDRNHVASVRASTDSSESEERSNQVHVTLRSGVAVDLQRLDRHFYTTSSCGVCGKTSLEALASQHELRLLDDSVFVDAERVLALTGSLRNAQILFEQTGGLHGAALFDAFGKLLCVREDVGRHNAVDKVIGSQFMEGLIPLSDRVLFVSGRASFELMQKALVAGIPILAAVGAPSSLAVDLARAHGATLLGFVRDGRMNIYSGAHRLRQVGADTTPQSTR